VDLFDWRREVAAGFLNTVMNHPVPENARNRTRVAERLLAPQEGFRTMELPSVSVLGGTLLT
jgi:hypothetical protein